MNLDITTFIKLAIDDLLKVELDRRKNTKEPLELDLSSLTLKNSTIDLNKTTYFNFRIDTVNLAKWDEYSTQNYMNRTDLVLLATEKSIHPTDFLPLRDYDRIKWILNNIIREFGLMDVDLIEKIFDTVDPSVLTKMLDTLEAKNYVMRKVKMPTFRTWGDERSSNICQVVEKFENIVEAIRKNELLQTDETSLSADFPLLEHELLLIVISEYLDILLKRFKAQLEDDESSPNFEHIQEISQELKNSFLDSLEKIKKMKSK